MLEEHNYKLGVIMNTIRYANERGYTKTEWLESFHSFSFDTYYDPKHMHFQSLRVINEDFIDPGKGFAAHSHHDMEIITYVLSGALEHKDSLGNKSTIRKGEVQLMRAGTGITHSEYNPLQDEAVHLLQIWIMPREKNLPPSYQQQYYTDTEKQDKLCPILNPSGTNGAMQIKQDVALFAGVTTEAKEYINYTILDGHQVWIQVVSGDIQINNDKLHAGDALSIITKQNIKIQGTPQGEILLFDFGKM